MIRVFRVSKSRNYDEEKKNLKKKAVFVKPDLHPLKPILQESEFQTKLSGKSTKQFMDPLNESDILDPLSKMVADASLREKVKHLYKFLLYNQTVKKN